MKKLLLVIVAIVAVFVAIVYVGENFYDPTYKSLVEVQSTNVAEPISYIIK